MGSLGGRLSEKVESFYRHGIDTNDVLQKNFFGRKREWERAIRVGREIEKRAQLERQASAKRSRTLGEKKHDLAAENLGAREVSGDSDQRGTKGEKGGTSSTKGKFVQDEEMEEKGKNGGKKERSGRTRHIQRRRGNYQGTWNWKGSSMTGLGGAGRNRPVLLAAL